MSSCDDTLDGELDRDWETAELSGDGTLTLFRHAGSVLSYFSCSWAPEAAGGRRRIAYLGAHAGFCWEDKAAESDYLKAALDHAGFDDEALAKIGLASCEDDLNGDDGGYWLVADEAKFAAVLGKCRELDEFGGDGEMSDDQVFSSLVREYGGEIEDENADAPGFCTTVDQHRGDHGPTGLRITEFTDVRTDFSDNFPGIAWGALSDAERETYREALSDIHEATVELESLDADVREAAKEALAADGASDPWDAADAIRRAIEAATGDDGDDDPEPGRRAYTVRMSDQGCAEYEEFEAADGEKAVEEARSRTEEWIRGGERGDEGASIDAHWTLYGCGRDEAMEGDPDEVDSGGITVEIEPDHESLMRRAGAPKDCDHDFVSTYEVDGGIRENPGVWSHGGTTTSCRSHCRHCGLVKIEVCYGSQRNPGRCDTVKYSMPDSWCGECESGRCEHLTGDDADEG